MSRSYLHLLILVMTMLPLSCSFAGVPKKGQLLLQCKNPKLQGTQFIGCDPESSFAAAKQLAKQNDPNALFVLGRVYELGGRFFGLPEVKEDFDLAQKYYLRAARLGNVEAEEAIGFIYRKWYPATRSRQGIYWECQAAKKGDVDGVINIKNHLIYEQKKESVDKYCQTIISKGEPKD